MTIIRAFAPADLPALYDICLKTGDAGQDAAALYADPDLLGAIYAAPYALLEPALAFVAEDEHGVAGYVLGALDTGAFEARLEIEWWPKLRAAYPDPRATPRDARSHDQQRAAQIHRPFPEPQVLVDAYPAHLHMNLTSRSQGRGVGARLLRAWLDLAAGQGVGASHVGVNRANEKAVRFWSRNGFAALRLDPVKEGRTVWMGRP